MALIYLAVSSTFSASGFTDQGSLDSGEGDIVGAAIPCPGVTPCRISLKCKLSGSHTTVVDSVYAGANHVVIQEYQHSQVPSVGNQVRLETINRSVKIAGGIYVEDPTSTSTPVLKPYYDIKVDTQTPPQLLNRGNISLKGLPTALFDGATFRARVGSNATASNVSNYYSVLDPFDIKFSSHYLDDGVNLLWNYATSGSYQGYAISVNLSGSKDDLYFTSSPTALTPEYNVKYSKFPAVFANTDLIDSDVDGNTTTAYRPAVTFLASELSVPLACFTGIPPTLSASVYGAAVGSAPRIKALAVYNSETVAGVYTFASINAFDNYAAIGMFNSVSDVQNPVAEFLESYTDPNRRASGIKPAFGFNPSYVSTHLAAGIRNSYWADAYPPIPTISYNEYEDIKSTQYGFIFLNKNTKHLEFLFQPHVNPWVVSATIQPINKIIHAPPRSADYYPALNMQWGIDPAKSTDPTATSLYKGQAEIIGTIAGTTLTVTVVTRGIIYVGMVITGSGITTNRTITTYTGATIGGVGTYTISGSSLNILTSQTFLCTLASAELTAVKNMFPEHINHGGGGHVMALGTYNGAIVNDGVVTVWGSNRWGQCVFPQVLKGRTIIDVAVSNAPPVLEEASTTFESTVYSDDGAEYAARTYSAIDPTTGANPFKYCYPHKSSYRFGRHINYTNLPGHVVVVDKDTGRVYAWGNNKYHQCSVPDEIAFTSDSGTIQTTVLTDPITEVSAGAFHTVARSKAGVLFVWGAGGPWVSETGRIPIAAEDTAPELPGSSSPGYPESVHFSQSMVYVVSPQLGFAISKSNPDGLTTSSSSEAGTGAGINLNKAANLTRIISGGSISVGQKSAILSGGVGTIVGTLLTLPITTAAVPGMLVTGVGVAAGTVVVSQLPSDQFTRYTVNISQNVALTTITLSIGTPICLADPAEGRLKGIIAAGAFHTAIIDKAYKIQCQGAGKGIPSTATAIGITLGVQINDNAANNNGIMWGSSYSYEDQLFSTYPHYCQGINQYTCPFSLPYAGTEDPYSTANLFRLDTDTTVAHKSRYFQDLQFKKVVCGPFSTHGIVYSVSRIVLVTPVPPTRKDMYTAEDKAYLHNRVVSWGCAHGTRSHQITGTGPTGILGQVFSGGGASSMGYSYSTTVDNSIEANPAGSLSGMGQIDFGLPANLPRMFEIINRPLPGMYANTASLVGVPGINGNSPTSVGSVIAGKGPSHSTSCPVTISRFKVKDLAVCGDYAAYISYVTTLNQGHLKVTPSDTTQPANDSGESYEYHASVVFTGNNYYRTTQGSSYSLYGRMHANNPYAGSRFTRRNKRVNITPATVDTWGGLTALNIKTKSMYFGDIKSTTNIVGGLVSDATADKIVSYLMPTTILASSNMVTAVVNMDNRPVAWSGYFNVSDNTGIYGSPIDLSLLPSVPLLQFKTGTTHAIGVADGDWPIAKSLSSAATTPKLVSELGAKLFTGTIPTTVVAPTLIYGDANKYKRPVLVAWGAGDGREYGTTLLCFGAGSGNESTYGMHFLDTHAVTRYDATYGVGSSQPLALNANDLTTLGTDPWENYYGEYRWNVQSTYDKVYGTPIIEGLSLQGPGLGSGGVSVPTTVAGEGAQSTAGAIVRPLGHHAVDAMQSMLSFRQDVYPTTYDTPVLTGRALLNGSTVAAIPSAVFRPFVDYAAIQTGPALNNTVCCATAADEAQSTYSSINSLQEYNSALGYMQQTYTDYVVDYAAGDMHSAVLFSSSCPDYSKIKQVGSKLTLNNGTSFVDATLSLFKSLFMSDAVGSIPFGNRRICKLGIVGYGCENQTAGLERQLPDGMAPIVPMMFSRDAKVYCGDSYTLVTNPIRVVTVENSAVPVVLTGTGTTTQIIPITVPASVYSKRIRGLDVVLTFTATSAATPIPLSSWNIKIPYKNNTWTVLGRVKANTAQAFIAPGTAITKFRVSDRFSTAKAYFYDTYTEVGLSPASISSSYTLNTNYYLNGYAASPAVPALSKQGCYYPVTVNPSTNDVTLESWSMTSANGAVYPFNEPTIDVVIEDFSGATSYAGYTIKVTLEIEVDASDVPYVIFGPSKSGVFNEIQGLGPSYAADTQSFLEDTTISLSSCPCEINNAPNTVYNINTRKRRPAFPADSKFICGTRKYGPSGNRENQAAYVGETRYDPVTQAFIRDPLLRGNRVTANFFSLFDTIPHRALLSMPDTLYAKGSTLQVLGTNAFVAGGGSTVNLITVTPALKLNTTSSLTVGLSARSSLILSTKTAVMYNKTLFGSVALRSTVTTVNTASTGFRLIVNMYSNCL